MFHKTPLECSVDHASGLVFHRPQAASPRRSVVYFCSYTLVLLRFAASRLIDPKRVCQRTTAQDLLLSDGQILEIGSPSLCRVAAGFCGLLLGHALRRAEEDSFDRPCSQLKPCGNRSRGTSSRHRRVLGFIRFCSVIGSFFVLAGCPVLRSPALVACVHVARLIRLFGDRTPGS